MQSMQASEFDISEIHDVDRASFRGQQIHSVYIVQLALGDMDETRNAAAQVEQRVHLDRCLGRSKVRPRKYRQTQVDRGRIEHIYRVRLFQTQILAGVETSRLNDQTGSEVGINAPVARFVGVDRRTGSRNPM